MIGLCPLCLNIGHKQKTKKTFLPPLFLITLVDRALEKVARGDSMVMMMMMTMIMMRMMMVMMMMMKMMMMI